MCVLTSVNIFMYKRTRGNE